MHSRNTASPHLSVAFLTPSWPPDAAANGIVTYVDVLSAALRRLGHRPCILAAHSKNPAGGIPPDDSADVYHLQQDSRSALSWIRDGLAYRMNPLSALRHKFSRSLVRAARRAVAESRIQLLEMEETFGLVQLLKGRLPIPIVLRLHGPHFLNGVAAGAAQDPAFHTRVRHEGIGISQAAAISAPSRDVLERVRARYQLPLPDAVVIGCPAPIVPDRDRWSLAGSDPDRLLFVGRFDRHKGGDVVIDSFRAVARRFPQVRLWYVGRDHGLVDETGRHWTLAQYLGDRAPEIAGRVDYLGSPSNATLQDLRRKARVTVVASRYENLPMVVMEALACGCPLVATRAGGIIEIGRDGENCLLARPGDPEDLAQAIGRLLADAELVARLGRTAADDANRLYHPDAIARQTIAFHQSVLENHKRNMRH